jgi:hypothetical protein
VSRKPGIDPLALFRGLVVGGVLWLLIAGVATGVWLATR